MIFLRSLVTAFSMYSKIPVPKIEWREENRRYALCFFPLIGIVIGVLFLLWRFFCREFEFGILLNSAVCTALPVLVTGGIHLDGFCDVSDAVSSYSEGSKKLEILSDPHIGAFAAIKLAVYLLLRTALYSELLSFSAELVTALGFVMSRAFSGLAAVVFDNAKKSGSLLAFSEPADKKTTSVTLGLFILLSAALMMLSNVLYGGLAVIACIVSFVVYRLFSYKQFGGITGDTAGWFLQVCELSILAAAVIAEKIGGLL